MNLTITGKDRELMLEHQAYFDWTKALWRRLIVEPAHPERRFRLVVDDEELNHLSPPDGSARFIAATRSFCSSYGDDLSRASDAADRIGRSNKISAPGSLGILAACVLIAARMGSEGQFNASAYHPRFNNEILGRSDRGTPIGFSRLGEKWLALKACIYNNSYGNLMLPRDPTLSPLRHKTHINYPLSQCLFRRIDLDHLADFFSDLSANGLLGEQAFTRLIDHVEYYRDVSAALIDSLDSARRDSELREAYIAAIDDLVVDEQRRKRSAPRSSRVAVGRDSFGLARLRLVPEPVAGKIFYDVILELFVDGTWEAEPEFRCEANDVTNGVTFEQLGIKYRHLGSEAAVFVQDTDYDLVTQRFRKLPARAQIVVLTSKDHEGELFRLASSIKANDDSIRSDARRFVLLERFSNLTAVGFMFSNRGLSNEPLPAFLNRYEVAHDARLAFGAGLSIDGKFLKNVPLRLELTIDEDTQTLPALYCDAIELCALEFEDRFEYDLSQFMSQVGQHFIKVPAMPSLQLAFTIADPPGSFTPPCSNGMNLAAYFGPEFLKYPNNAQEFRMACRQAQEPTSDYVLMQGAFVIHRSERSSES